MTYDEYPDDIQPTLEALSDEIDGLTDDLEAGVIRPETWLERMASVISGGVALGYMIGAGTAQIAGEALDRVRAQITEQLGYLQGFHDEISAAGEWRPAWRARAQLYSTAPVVPYWQGKTERWPLPSMPGEGTQCRRNCKCKWRIEVLPGAGNANCYWELLPAEHCQTCLERNARWYPLRIRGMQIQPYPDWKQYFAEADMNETEIAQALKEIDDDLEALKGEIAATFKHLPGKHDQKRHGWRFGSVSAARRSLRGRSAEERAEYRKRAGMPEPKKIEKPKVDSETRELIDKIERSIVDTRRRAVINLLRQRYPPPEDEFDIPDNYPTKGRESYSDFNKRLRKAQRQIQDESSQSSRVFTESWKKIENLPKEIREDISKRMAEAERISDRDLLSEAKRIGIW